MAEQTFQIGGRGQGKSHHELPCGCVFEWLRGTGDQAAGFTYCPMHKAAPQMLRALEKLAEDARAYPYDPLGSLDHLDEIIAQARGQEAGT